MCSFVSLQVGPSPLNTERMLTVPTPTKDKPEAAGCSWVVGFLCARRVDEIFFQSSQGFFFLVCFDFHLWSTTGLNCWISLVFIISYLPRGMLTREDQDIV